MFPKPRMQIIQFLTVISCLLSTTEADAEQWIQNTSNGHYYARTEAMTWEGAERYAVSQGGHLVAITDAQEQEWLVDTFGGDEEFWIGLNDRDQEGRHVWTSGEPVTYVNWAPGEPDDSVPILPLGETWHTHPTSGHCYALYYWGYWRDAECFARSCGGHLVSIGSRAEQDWLTATFGGKKVYWIGFTDEAEEGHWVWTSGEPVTFKNWHSGEPSDGGWFGHTEDYAVMNWGSDDKWNDLGPRSLQWDDYPGIIEVDSEESRLHQDCIVMNAKNPGQWADRLGAEVDRAYSYCPRAGVWKRALIELASTPQQLAVYYPGRLQVTIQPPEAVASGARWRIGEGAWRLSGQTIDVEPGRHHVQFDRVDGWEEPQATAVYLSGKETTAKEYVYESLSCYDIGAIPPQTVWHDRTMRFLVAASAPEEIAAYADPTPQGVLSFQPSTGQFSYTPAPEDKEAFEVIFQTSQGRSQAVTITPMAHLAPEETIVGRPGSLPDPESGDYVLLNVTESRETEPFNHGQRTTRSISISGYTVVFEEGHENDLYETLNFHPGVVAQANIRDLTICAETVVVRSPLRLPQTNVTVYAREIRFEDPEGAEPNWACIDTTPLSPEEAGLLLEIPTDVSDPIVDGKPGLNAGDIELHVERFSSKSPCPGCQRFTLRGGKGQEGSAGRDGYYYEYPYGSGRFECVWTLDYSKPPDERKWYEVCHDHIVVKAKRDGSYVWYGHLDENDRPIVPADGGDAVPAGKPGNGGDAGDMWCTLPDLGAFVNLSGGEAGQKGDDHEGGLGAEPREAWVLWDPGGTIPWHWELYESQDGNDAPAPNADVPVGSGGTFIHLDPHFSWLHPLAVERVLDYIKDAYIAGHFAFVQGKCEEYTTIIGALEGYFPQGKRDDFAQLKQELLVLRDRVAHNLDYFGKPAGWVPMLSLEVNMGRWKEEIKDSIRGLYLTYWLGVKAAQAASQKEALEYARDRIATTLSQQREDFDDAQAALASVFSLMDHLSYRMPLLQLEIQDREEQLRHRAESNVEERHKLPFWKTGLRVLGSVLKVVPIHQPALGAVGTGLDFLSRIDPDEPLESLWEARDIWSTFRSGAYKEKAATIMAALRGMDLTDTRKYKENFNALKTISVELEPAVKEIGEVLKTQQASASEIEAELAKLEAEDPIFQDLVAQMRAFNVQKTELAEQLTIVNENLLQLIAAIEENLAAGDAIYRNLPDVLEKLDHRTLAYIKQMERRQKDRLLKYQYLCAKAYEYRMLAPYRGDLNLDRLFDSFKKLAVEKGHLLDDDVVEELMSLYTEELGRITAEIWHEVNDNAPGKSNYSSFGLTAEETRELNEEGKVTINLIDRKPALFDKKWEDFRIFKLEVDELLVRPVGGAYGETALLFLVFEHSGLSKLSSGGQTYLFRHYRDSEVNPITWDTVYDGISQEYHQSEPSLAHVSLIEYLLGLQAIPFNEEHLMLYSRPAAWADIIIYKDTSTAPGVDMVIDSLRLRVRFDYFSKSAKRADLTVEVSGDLMPNIFVSTPDLNGRQDGRGDFRRAFPEFQHVTLRAQPVYGTWVFQAWKNGDEVVAWEPAIDIVLEDHMSLTAVYEQSPNMDGGVDTGQ